MVKAQDHLMLPFWTYCYPWAIRSLYENLFYFRRECKCTSNMGTSWRWLHNPIPFWQYCKELLFQCS